MEKKLFDIIYIKENLTYIKMVKYIFCIYKIILAIDNGRMLDFS